MTKIIRILLLQKKMEIGGLVGIRKFKNYFKRSSEIQLNKRSAVPRHNEIRDILAIKICKDLGFSTIPLDIFPTIDYIR